jgi:hydrogenase maturation protein HypF
MAVSALHAGGLSAQIPGWLAELYPERDAKPLLAMLDKNLRCPPTSSLGRLFDAAAGLLGLRAESFFEGQAAMELEGLALNYGEVPPKRALYEIREGMLDFTPLLITFKDCHDKGYGAALFHATVAAGLAEWLLLAPQECFLRGAVNRENVGKIVVGGGCAMNGVLMQLLRGYLESAGVTMFEAKQVPPNDGGLALGQALIARQMRS